MTNLLIFFALPIAVIIISIALQKIFRSPVLVAAIIFAIFLVVTFVIGNINFLIATIAYTILAFLTAYFTMWICRFLEEFNNNRRPCRNNRENCSCNNNGIQVNSIVYPDTTQNGRFTGTYQRR